MTGPSIADMAVEAGLHARRAADGAPSFGEMAAVLEQQAMIEQLGRQHIEHMNARQPHEVMARTLLTLDHGIAALAAAAALLKRMAPFEAQMLAFLELSEGLNGGPRL